MKAYTLNCKKILARPLDSTLKYLQEQQIQYTIKSTKPVSKKFSLSEQNYCIGARFLAADHYELVIACKQIGLDN